MYTPIVSDVSDEELEKNENAIQSMLLAAHHIPFNIVKPNRGCQACSTRKAIKSPNIYKFNPIRSAEAMTELSKKRWVSYICNVMVF